MAFCQPADDLCAAELGLDPDGADHETCCYAFTDYQPDDKICNCCAGSYASDNQRNVCIAVLSHCLASAPDIDSAELDQCVANGGW